MILSITYPEQERQAHLVVKQGKAATMNGNLQRIHQITGILSETEWVNSRLTFHDPAAKNTFAECVLRTPYCTILRWFIPAGDIVKMHIHAESCEVLIVETGELPLQLDKEQQDLGPGNSIRIPPRAPHGCYRPLVEDSVVLGITLPPAKEFDEPKGVRDGNGTTCIGSTSTPV